MTLSSKPALFVVGAMFVVASVIGAATFISMGPKPRDERPQILRIDGKPLSDKERSNIATIEALRNFSKTLRGEAGDTGEANGDSK